MQRLPPEWAVPRNFIAPMRRRAGDGSPGDRERHAVEVEGEPRYTAQCGVESPEGLARGCP